MDPYLESVDIWPDFQDALIQAIRVDLNKRLPQPYYARSQKRAELGVAYEGGHLRRIIPDVVVAQQPQPGPSPASAMVIEQPHQEPTAGLTLRIHTDRFQHRFLEIRDAAHNHKLVTLIEVVSPANKQPGPDRRAYEAKQQEILETDANLIELDLLRQGRHLLPYPELVDTVETLGTDYLVLLNRAAERTGLWLDYTLYPVGLRESLPCIPVPLVSPDPDILLDLQIIFNRLYQEGPYSRLLDYTAPPVPDFAEADATWAAALLVAAGLRA